MRDPFTDEEVSEHWSRWINPFAVTLLSDWHVRACQAATLVMIGVGLPWLILKIIELLYKPV